MICPNCGKELSDTAKFCSGCGTKVVAEQPAENAAEQSEVYGIPAGSEVTDAFPAQETEVPAQTAAFDVPAGNVITGTLPAQDTASTATAVLPEMTNVLQAETVKPEKKKFSPKKLIGLGVAAAGVVVAGVVVSGLTFAKADFTHTFMGNKKYATAVMGQQIEQVVNTPALFGVMSAAGASTSSDDTTGALVSSLASFKSAIPASGAEIELSVSADFSDDDLAEFADSLDCDTDKAKEILEAVKNLKVKAGVQFSENGIAATAAGTEQDKELIKVNALYDAESEAYYISVPGVSDECLMFADDDAVIDMEELNSQTDDKAAKEMLEDVLKAYKDSLDDAEIVYEKTTFSIGDVEFKGKMSSVTLEDEAVADMLSNVSDAFFDSEFAEVLGDTDEIQDEVDSAIIELEDIDNIKVVIDNFVNSNNTVAGLRVGIEVKNGGSKAKSEMAYLNCKDGIACSVEVDDETMLEFSQEKENNSTGKFTGKVSDGYSSGKFTIDYENYTEKKMFGQNVALGDYTIKVSGDLFDTEDVPFEKFTVKISDDNNKLNYDIGLNIEGSTFNAKLALSDAISETITAESMKISEAYDAMDEADEDKVNEYYTKLIEYMANQTKDSEFFNSVPVNDGTLADELQATAKRALRERELVENYADYNEETVYDANEAATQICYSARYINFNIATGAAKVKLYYDKDGKLSILDSAGMSALENEILEKLGDLGYKNAYVEIVVWPGRGPVCGANVVMTDNSSNIPDNLPDEYNFLDRQYKWGTDEDVNFVGSFAVGTYPRLANGEGGETKAADDKLAADVKTYNADAEKAAKAIENFTGFTYDTGKGYLVFEVSDGKWNFYCSGGSEPYALHEEINDYLTKNVGAVEAKYFAFYFEDGKLVGTVAADTYYNSYVSFYDCFAVEDFNRGSTEVWSYMDGIVSGSVVGTYPELTKLTSAPQEYLDAMVGTWFHREYDSITITSDDLKNIAEFGFNRSNGSISNLYVSTIGNGSYFYHLNADNPYISDGWGEDYYK